MIMIGGFFGCVAAGPVFVILLVVLVQGLVYKEVIFLAAVPSREKKLPWFRAMNWYVDSSMLRAWRTGNNDCRLTLLDSRSPKL